MELFSCGSCLEVDCGTIAGRLCVVCRILAEGSLALYRPRNSPVKTTSLDEVRLVLQVLRELAFRPGLDAILVVENELMKVHPRLLNADPQLYDFSRDEGVQRPLYNGRWS